MLALDSRLDLHSVLAVVDDSKPPLSPLGARATKTSTMRLEGILRSMNVVLISTYELGRQPFGVVSPAAWLRKRGHQVACFDLTRQELDQRAVRAAALIAIYLPMHTATRLAAKLIPTLRERNPGAHVCCYGLYAPMNAEYLRTLGARTILGGEFEGGLVSLADRIGAQSNGGEKPSHAGPAAQLEPLVSLERLAFEVPDRAGMPALAKYAHLIIPGGGYRVVGSTEASRGCKHLCRHCQSCRSTTVCSVL